MWWIIVQGSMLYYKAMKKALKNYDCVVWSGWKEDLPTLRDENHVVINEKPKDFGNANINLQLLSTLNGIKYARSKNAKYVVKLRSDLVPTKIENFLQCLSLEGANFLTVHQNNYKPYLLDYVFAGDIDDMEQALEDCLKNKTLLPNFYQTQFPEAYITSSFIKTLKPNKLSKMKFFLSDINVENDLYWIKKNLYISDYKNMKCYELYPNLLNLWTY